MKPKSSLFIVLPFAFFLAQSVSSHPIPDVPVRSSFERDGTATIQVEIEPRCFGEDPPTAPYLFKKEFEELTAVEGGTWARLGARLPVPHRCDSLP